MTVSDCAAAAGTGRRTIYTAIRSGRLRAAVVNGRGDFRVHPDWFSSWCAWCTTPEAAAERQQIASARRAATDINPDRHEQLQNATDRLTPA